MSELMILPVHPTTGLTALGFTRRGPVWPVCGAAETDPSNDPPPNDPPPAGDPPAEETLGAGGVKALKAEREAHKAAKATIKDLQTQLAAAKADGAPEFQQQINDLQTKLDAEITARADAEQAAQAALLAQLRTDRGIEKGLPATAAKKLAGTLAGETPEAIDAEIDEWLPLLNTTGPTGMAPNPQQGVPSRARGGSVAAGRERYAATRK